MNFPLVSICIPTFNGAQFIGEAMASAIAQTYPNLEIVVSDDASVDETLHIIETYKTKTSIPISIYRHEPNGIGANWNHCIERAQGVYIKFLFQDDVLLPNCIEAMVNVLEQNDLVALVACKREFIVEPSYLNENTSKWMEHYGNLQQSLNLSNSNGHVIIDKSIFKSNIFFNSPRNKVGEPTTVLFRKEVIQHVGYFREDLIQVLDYEFYCRLLKNYKIVILEKVLVKFRLHNAQTTIANKGYDQMDYEIYDKLMYTQYFWQLNLDTKLYYLKKYNQVARYFFKALNAIKRKL